MSQSDIRLELAPVQLHPYDPAERFVSVENYALQPFPLAFVDIEVALEGLFKQRPDVKLFDATAFYSKRRPRLTTDAESELARFNQLAFDAAKRIGGLVVYYQGQLLDNPISARPSPALDVGFLPDCLSFCIWESHEQALNGADITAHKEAARRVGEWYMNFAIRKFTITPGVSDSDISTETRSVTFQAY